MSKIIECENGHYYDSDIFSYCPHCKRERVYARNYIGKDKNEENTLRMDLLNNGVNPVIGWLVCIKGFMRGQDYRLLGGFNRVGSQASDDIVIFDDKIENSKTICSIVYDSQSKNTFLVPESDIPVVLNGTQINDIVMIHSEDKIRICDTEYIFILFCSGSHTWEMTHE